MRLVQTIDYAAIAPPVILALTALAVLVADLFLPARGKRLLPVLSLTGTAGAFAAVVALATGPDRATFRVAGSPSYVADGFTLFLQGLLLAALAVVVLLSLPVVDDARIPPGEYHFLLLASVTGMLTLVAGRDLITVLVALEVVSLPAFVLAGLRRSDPRSSEAALKFFLISVLSTAVMIYGMALTYGVTGSVSLQKVSAALAAGHLPSRALAAAAVVMVIVGFAFKVSAVPFHSWTPDTYQGSPVPIAAFLSVASKGAGFAGLLVVLRVGFAPYADIWGPVVAVLAALTMTVGNVIALRQWHMVRLLAWSSIAQAGYILMPLGVAATVGGRSAASLDRAFAATIGYLAIYVAMNLGAFACVVAVGRRHPRQAIADYRGLVRSAPWLAIAFGFFLTCLAGLPPGLAGLFAKVVVLRATVAGHVTWLAVIAAVNSVIGLAYYLRVAASLFAGVGEERPAPAAGPKVAPTVLAGLALAAAATLVFSVWPQAVLHVPSPLGH